MYQITERDFKELPVELQSLYEKLPNKSRDEVRECFPENRPGFSGGGGPTRFANASGGEKLETYNYHNDSGNASRFFKSILYYPKASKSERNKGMDDLEAKPMYKADGSGQSLEIFGSTDGGREDRKNNHPTVKPTALMSYLIKMITPKGGIVLEPFAGSGSTLVAAKENGFQYIGIEMTEEYLPIIQARTGCEIIKPNFYRTTGIDNAIKEQEEDNIKANKEIDIKHEINLDKCPKCNGRLKKTKYGMTCEDCFWEIESK